MTASSLPPARFRAAPVTEFQVIVSNERPDAPTDYVLTDVGGAWLAAAPQFRTTELTDASGRKICVLAGLVYNEWTEDFFPAGSVTIPVEAPDIETFERAVMTRIAGAFVAVTAGDLPRRLYPDHAGSISMVYLAEERRAASSPAMLLDEAQYKARINESLYDRMIVQETSGCWISGTLTAHHGVYRLLSNHYLDLATWTATRFWPRPGEFDGWRDMATTTKAAAEAVRKFSDAVCRNYRVAVTLTAGFDTRLILASCRAHLPELLFFTTAAPGAEIDMDMGHEISKRFGFRHENLPVKQATPEEMAVWDRMAGDVVIEAPRFTYPTLRGLTDRDVLLTGLFGEVGRCRYYRQDYKTLNDAEIDANFVIDRLTIPPHPELVENIATWMEGLKGQPNSVILDIALHELKLGSWAMPQRSMTNSVKFAFNPMAQRVVFDCFVGVEPTVKDEETLFWMVIKHLWPELSSIPINEYGDWRDYLVLWRKLMDPIRRRRYIRDRFAKKVLKTEPRRQTA